MNEDPIKQDESSNDEPSKVTDTNTTFTPNADSIPDDTNDTDKNNEESTPTVDVNADGVPEITESQTPEPAQPPIPAIINTPTETPEPTLTPASSQPTVAPAQVSEAKPSMPKLLPLLIGAVAAAVLIVVAGLLAYHMGKNHGYTDGKNAETAAMTSAELKVPAGATMIAQCATGEGTQYVLPSDIPTGPIYNVWNGKVTGIEYMLAQSSIAALKTQNLPLQSQNFNHVDVMYEPTGHAGFTEPHYHVVLSMIPYSEEQKITCSGSSSSTMNSMM